MTKLLTVLICSFGLTSCISTLNRDGDKERLDKVCNEFMQTFSEGKIQQAMDLLKQNTFMSPSTVDTLQATIRQQADKILPAYGKMLSYEFVSERKVKNFITKRFYILKLENYYLKFDFTEYNNGKGWTITSFTYNEDLTEVLY